MTREQELEQALRDALDYIDALPKEVVAALPPMPGFGRDEVEALLAGVSPEDRGVTYR